MKKIFSGLGFLVLILLGIVYVTEDAKKSQMIPEYLLTLFEGLKNLIS